MKVEYLNPFIKSVVKIVEESISEKPAMGKVFLRDHLTYESNDVAVVVGVTGHLSGHMVITLSEESAKNIAAAMMMEPKVYAFDEVAQSALAEMSNMIAANATIGLAEAGYTCDITPPHVFTGSGMAITGPPNSRTVVIPLNMGAGTLEVNLTLAETAA